MQRFEVEYDQVDQVSCPYLKEAIDEAEAKAIENAGSTDPDIPYLRTGIHKYPKSSGEVHCEQGCNVRIRVDLTGHPIENQIFRDDRRQNVYTYDYLHTNSTTRIFVFGDNCELIEPEENLFESQ